MCLPSLLPVLVSCADDFDPQIRYQAVMALRQVFSITTQPLEESQVVSLVRDMMKRLDDSNDEIRIQICSTLSAFFPHFPRDVEPSHYKYLIKGVLIHLDDPNPAIKEAVFETLKTWGPYNRDVFFTEVHNVREKHTTPLYCDRLLQLTSEF
eukprot:TRINITY_DN9015_c0_g1_i1.p1 TRINITY_DN9015_c0_g1~~TRINITY_DN9015_c0_g1_i1.p1  ORF type:complete len:152 (+),score=21.24 TRINITY_DN9015_c0_g1_i1:70-525(+)